MLDSEIIVQNSIPLIDLKFLHTCIKSYYIRKHIAHYYQVSLEDLYQEVFLYLYSNNYGISCTSSKEQHILRRNVHYAIQHILRGENHGIVYRPQTDNLIYDLFYKYNSPVSFESLTDSDLPSDFVDCDSLNLSLDLSLLPSQSQYLIDGEPFTWKSFLLLLLDFQAESSLHFNFSQIESSQRISYSSSSNYYSKRIVSRNSVKNLFLLLQSLLSK